MLKKYIIRFKKHQQEEFSLFLSLIYYIINDIIKMINDIIKVCPDKYNIKMFADDILISGYLVSGDSSKELHHKTMAHMALRTSIKQ